MVDNLSKKNRSLCMSRIRSKNMKPELLVRSMVHGLGYRFRLHRRDLAGKPDLVLSLHRSIIFVNGCFWHWHSDPECPIACLPKSNLKYWKPKLELTRIRDRENVASLKSDGWRVLTIWECHLLDLDGVLTRIREFLKEKIDRSSSEYGRTVHYNRIALPPVISISARRDTPRASPSDQMTNRIHQNGDADWAIRAQAFAALKRLAYSTGVPIPWAEISKGFLHQGERIHFASKAPGIFKPRQMTAALSIKTVMPRAGRPTWYRDQRAYLDVETGLLPYDLARKSADHTNNALKLAYQRRAPLIYFRAVRSALYEAIWPVWVEDFRADEGRVLVTAANPARGDAVPDEWPRPNTSIGDRERSYSLRMTRHRNHQAWFSKHVRSVYGYRCAFSNLPLGKLLVGAHIKADEEGGPASASNGICMSTLHHAAFDSYLIGVDPDLKIHVSRSIFDADDGPLLASLQGLDGATLRVPQVREAIPDPGFLEWRFDKFKAVQD